MIESSTERQLRESLRRSAERAPDGTTLAERIIAAAAAPDARVVHRSFRWQTWVTPLVSAAAVAAVAVAVVTAAQSDEHSAASGVAASHAGSAPHFSAGAGQAGTGATAACPAARCASSAPTGAAASSAARVSGSASASSVPALSGFRVSDLTFVSDTEGWAIGSADCLDGSGGRCPAMVHTTDGAHWRSMPPPPVARGHADLGIRFATDQVGYAFDPTVLYMTTDGGHSWQRQSGGALALETLDGNVVRLISPHSGCPGPCRVQVQIAGVGSAVWSTLQAAGAPVDAASVALARAGSQVYVLAEQHAATSTLAAFTDRSGAWQTQGEPCSTTAAGASGNYASIAVAAGSAARVAVLCRSLDGGTPERVALSTDAGAHFVSTGGALPAQGPELLAANPGSVLLVGGATGVFRSADGGASWQRAPQLGGVSFLGFESASVARAVSADGSTVWTTTDAGSSWTATHLG